MKLKFVLVFIFCIEMIVPALSETTDKTDSIELTNGWEYAIGDSPVDDKGIPVWTYDFSGVKWKANNSLINPPGRDKSNFFWYHIKIPGVTIKNPTLFIPKVVDSCDVFISKKRIYSSVNIKSERDINKDFQWHIIPIDPGYENTTLSVRVYSQSRIFGFFGNFRISTKSDHIEKILRDDILKLILSGIMFCAGIMSIIAFILLRKHKEYLGFGIINFSSIPIIMYLTDLTQLVGFYHNLLGDLYIIAFVFFPFAITYFFEKASDPIDGQFLKIIWKILLLYAITSVLLYVMKVITYNDIILSLLIEGIFYTFVYLPFLFYKLIRQSLEVKLLLLSSLIPNIFAVGDYFNLFVDYNNEYISKGYIGIYAYIGLLIFIFVSFIVLIKRFSDANAKLVAVQKELLENTEAELERNKEMNVNLERKVKERTDELVRTNEKLKELDIAKTEFFANISHELRTPLTLILAPVESLMNGDYGESISIDDNLFKSLHYNTIRLLKLINSLLDFSKIKAGRMNVKRQKSDIGSLLQHYASSFKSSIESKGLSMEVIDNTSGVISYVDQDLFEKVVYNLVSNAMKFTPAGGKIIITLNLKGNNFIISIEDTGIGIPENKLNEIFDRFTQVDSSTSRKYEGTGIGLSLTKEIVKLHDGRIEVKSKEGEGSTFIIEIPLSNQNENEEINENFEEKIDEINPYLWKNIYSSAEDTRSIEKIEDQKKFSSTIMIVDDSSAMVNFIEKLLSKSYNIITASNGKDAFNKLNSGSKKPDLILSDVMMPEMDGCEFTELLSSHMEFNTIPIILITARADAKMKVKGIEKGAIDYIVKPFNPKELVVRVKSQLELKKMRDSLFESNQRLQHIIDDSSILVSDIGHRLYHELSPFSAMILMSKKILDSIHYGTIEMTDEELVFFKDILIKSEKAFKRIEYLKTKIKNNFGKISEKKYNRIGFVIDELLDGYYDPLSEKGITLEKDFDFDQSKELLLNTEQIKTALENVINNAVKELESILHKQKIEKN